MDTNWKAGLTADPFGPWRMTPPPAARVSCGELEMQRSERRVSVGGVPLQLTDREYELLLCLAEHANRVVRRADILAAVWSMPDDDGSNLVAVYIRRLRQKLGRHAGMIITVRGTGYRLRPLLGTPLAGGERPDPS
jgi:DNA-binding response OmpR family regulator